MRIQRDDNEYRMVAEIYPWEDNDRCIRVERGRERSARPFGSKWEPHAEIHWGASSRRDIEYVRAYAEAMLEACRIAEAFDKVPHHEYTTPDGYMVIYQQQGTGRTFERRVENGSEVEMWDGWTVAKKPVAA